MRDFVPEELSRAEAVALINGLVAPRPIAWVATTSRDGAQNLAPFSFFNAFSTDPITLGIGPGSRGGVHKDSLANVKETGEFTVSVVTEALAGLANLASAEFEPSVNEWEIAGVTPRPSAVVGPPSVAESPAAFECRVFQIVDLGSPDRPTNSLVIGRVVRMHVEEALLTGDSVGIDAGAAALVGRMGGSLWCTTADRFSLRRPTVDEGLAGVPLPSEPDPG